MPRLILLTAGVLLVAPWAANAQWYGGGPWAGYGYDRASTPAESYARGMSDIVRSAGVANVLNSQAANNWEAARSANYDNQVKWVNTFWEKRRLGKMYRDAERRPRPTHEDMVRYAEQAAPKDLSSSQLDKLDGAINWPIVLKSDMYSKQREELDKLYKEHAEAGGGLNSPAYASIQSVGSEMLSELKDHASDYPPEQYLQARRFLESLRYEARQPAGA